MVNPQMVMYEEMQDCLFFMRELPLVRCWVDTHVLPSVKITPGTWHLDWQP